MCNSEANDTSPSASTSKRKKGVRNETKKQLIKRSRLQGKEYLNTSGKTVPAKNLGEITSCCKLKCYSKITDEFKFQAFHELYSLSTKNEQDIFLQSLLQVKDIKKRRPRLLENNKRRLCSFNYFIKVHDAKKRVCKKLFMSIYSIKNKALFRLQQLLQQGKIPQDQRGKQQNQKIIPVDVILQVKNHIESFPVKQSHYSSKEYNYLSAELNIKKMFIMFKNSHPETKVKQSFYYKIFKEHFDLHFGRPAVDACCECERLNIRINSTDLGERAIMAAKAELTVHKKRATKFYASLREVEKMSENEEDVLGITFDFMQNISLPCIPVQEMFYYRQLSLYPFCIKNLKSKESRFFLYHEGVAMKGPNETCSFLLQYIQEQVPSMIKKLYIFSDAAGGQNRNHMMISLCQALVDTGRFDKIIHRFPVRGHSFLPNDRSFGTVKKVLKQRDRYYLPKEVCEFICNAHKKFTVSMVNIDDILDFKNWWGKFYKKDAISLESQSRSIPRSDKQHFLVSNFMEFEYSSNMKGMVITRPFIGNGVRTNTFDLRKNKTQTVTLPTQKAYDGPVPLKINKIEDLKRTMQYILPEHKAYYENIIENWPKC